MADPIQLEIVEPTPVPAPPAPPEMARSQINSDQVAALITLIATANPTIINLPVGKAFSDMKGFNVTVLPNGDGIVHARF